MCIQPIPVWLRRVENGKQILSFHKPSQFAPNASPTYSVPCGKCPLCLERKRQDWIRRILLESWLHNSNSFVTLTYDNQHLPIGGVANKDDVQKFLKRFRHASRDFGIPTFDFKYFIVSEYGEKLGRPHYHGIVFGVDFRAEDWKPYFATLKADGNAIYSSSILEKIWRNGFVSIDRLTPHNIAYVCKYITKDGVRPSVKLFSRGFGKSIFFNRDNTLTSFGRDSFKNGFIVYPFGNSRFFKSSIPKNIDRYLSLYDESLYNDVKEARREFAKCKIVSSAVLADACDNLTIKMREANKKRILDNET